MRRKQGRRQGQGEGRGQGRRRQGGGQGRQEGGQGRRRVGGQGEVSRVGVGRPVGFRGVQTGQGLPPAVGIGRATRAIRLASAEAVARPRRRRSRAEDNPKDEEVPARPRAIEGATRREGGGGHAGRARRRRFLPRHEEFAVVHAVQDVPHPIAEKEMRAAGVGRERGGERERRVDEAGWWIGG